MRLGVSLDSVVDFRNLGETRSPDPIHMVPILEMNGVESIVCTLLADGRNQQEISLLKAIVHTHLNVRMTIDGDLAFVGAVQPGMVTLVGRSGAADLSSPDRLQGIVQQLRQKQIVTSILVNTTVDDVKTAVKLGFDYVELDATRLVRASSIPERDMELDNLKNLAGAAAQLGVGVTAGGPLDSTHLTLLRDIRTIEEVNVGHSLFARAFFKGLEQSVKEFVTIVHS